MDLDSRSRAGRGLARWFARCLPAAAVLCASAAAGTLALWACGPYFPNWILGTDAAFLQAPGGLLRQEVQRLRLSGDPFAAQPPPDDPFRQTAQADAADLQKALAQSELSAERRQALLAKHAALRDLLLQHAQAHGVWREQEAGTEAPLAADVAVPDGLPGEFADYLQGAVSYHQGRLAEAAAAWQRLLRRPAADRRMRSTWAAFMLGKAALRRDRKVAVRWFETTRELATHGFEDSLGLAAASLGWQARAERQLGRIDRALVLYARQARTGDPLALSSLQHLCREALRAGGDSLTALARTSDARDVMTAFLVSDHHGSWDGPAAGEAAQATAPDVAAWLKAVRAAGVKEAAGAERLAWAAYLGGDFAAAHDWVERAADDAPMALWVRAKLLLRDGQVAAAQQLMDQVARSLPAAELSEDELYALGPEAGFGKLATPSLAYAEEGALLLTEGSYAQALDRFLRGGFWLDAAYVADRVLTVDELKAYVDATWPERLAEGRPSTEEGNYLYSGLQPPEAGQLAHDLRYLLGRRLVRNGRYAEAKAYLPADVQPLNEALAKAMREARDTARPAEQRARALFQAACVTRRQGMQLIGSENEPDWTYLLGNYELDAFPEAVAARAGNKVLVPAADEAPRASRSRAEPWKRFHYRYRAADLADQAAALLPDGSEDKARMLATAGSWLKARDPEAAAPFLKALLSCCRGTSLGREAERLHRLPDAPECEMGVTPLQP